MGGDNISINSAPAHVSMNRCASGAGGAVDGIGASLGTNPGGSLRSAQGVLGVGGGGGGSVGGVGGVGGGGVGGGGPGGGGGGSGYRGHIVRLNSIEPNTVMFSTKDYPILSDVSVPEIIDELEKQFEDKLSDLQGVRLVSQRKMTYCTLISK